jgi:hypothetical protein
MATEQPPIPKPRRIAASNAAWLPAPYELADITAVQAVHRGDASPDQQRRALAWIINQACGTYDFSYRPGADDRETNLALGRQFVGQQLVKLLYLNASALQRSEPNADPPKG